MNVRPAAEPRERVTIRPEPAGWRTLLAAGAPSDGERRRFREQLGLPTDRPVIMTGHQAEFWHPGILAKYLAAEAAAISLGASPAWLVVDQDTAEAGAVRYPARREDGRLVAEWCFLDPDAPPAPDTPAASRPPLRPGPLRLAENSTPPAFVREGLERIAGAMREHAAAPTLGRQVAAALRDLLAPLVGPAPTVLASALAATDLFAGVVGRMEREPERAVGSYNTAAAAHPSSGIRRLLADEVNDRYELPLWRLQPGRPRRRVYAEDLPGIPREELAPRALLMTGLLRHAGCDLFIHGTGGGGTAEHEGYDAVTERWLGEWLGWSSLAPVTVATATRFLPLDAEAPPTPEETAHAAWLAHSARHDPGLLGDRSAAERKRSLVKRIRELKRTGEAAPAFAEMHTLLEDVRRRWAGRLVELDRQAQEAKARLQDAAILYDRTWAFPLYPAETLGGLREAVRAAFSGL